MSITFAKNHTATPKKEYKVVEEDELRFPEYTYTVTDQYGNVTTHKSRQKTIYRDGKSIVWTNADIEAYEKMKDLLARYKALNEDIENLALQREIDAMTENGVEA